MTLLETFRIKTNGEDNFRVKFFLGSGLKLSKSDSFSRSDLPGNCIFEIPPWSWPFLLVNSVILMAIAPEEATERANRARFCN